MEEARRSWSTLRLVEGDGELQEPTTRSSTTDSRFSTTGSRFSTTDSNERGAEIARMSGSVSQGKESLSLARRSELFSSSVFGAAGRVFF